MIWLFIVKVLLWCSVCIIRHWIVGVYWCKVYDKAIIKSFGLHFFAYNFHKRWTLLEINPWWTTVIPVILNSIQLLTMVKFGLPLLFHHKIKDIQTLPTTIQTTIKIKCQCILKMVVCNQLWRVSNQCLILNNVSFWFKDRKNHHNSWK